jgi:hypothetical protein
MGSARRLCILSVSSVRTYALALRAEKDTVLTYCHHLCGFSQRFHITESLSLARNITVNRLHVASPLSPELSKLCEPQHDLLKPSIIKYFSSEDVPGGHVMHIGKKSTYLHLDLSS